MSPPVSARITWATLGPTPGMVCSSSSWCAQGRQASAITASSSASASSTSSRRCSMVCASWACCSLKCPVSASTSCGILIRILPRASWASTAGSRSPAISAASIAHAETLVRLAATEGSLIEASSSMPSSRATSRVRSPISCTR